MLIIYIYGNRIAISGIFIFNQPHAVFTSLYLAIILAVATPATTHESLTINNVDLCAILWSFLLGFLLPMLIMGLPGLFISNLNRKHIVASFISSGIYT